MTVKNIEINRFDNAWTIEVAEEGVKYEDQKRYVFKTRRELFAFLMWVLAEDGMEYRLPDGFDPDTLLAPGEQTPKS